MYSSRKPISIKILFTKARDGRVTSCCKNHMIEDTKKSHKTCKGKLLRELVCAKNILRRPDWRRTPAAAQLSPVISSSWIHAEHKSSRSYCQADLAESFYRLAIFFRILLVIFFLNYRWVRLCVWLSVLCDFLLIFVLQFLFHNGLFVEVSFWNFIETESGNVITKNASNLHRKYLPKKFQI